MKGLKIIAIPRPKISKYNNKKTLVDNIFFDSKAEANRYCELKQLIKSNQIQELKLQPRFLLQEKFSYKDSTYRKIEYVADFEYIENGQVVVEDVKGVQTEVFKIKMKLLLKKYNDIDFRLIK